MKWRMCRESSDDFIYVPTGLKGKLANEILDSVIGQMSDGKWENSPAMEHYWRFVEVENRGGQIYLKVLNASGERPYDKYVDNYFATKMRFNEDKIRQFMAKRVKEVAKEELKDTNDPIGWDRNNEMKSDYLAGTISDCYFVYETLLGRSGYQRKYPRFMSDALLA